MFYFTLAFLTLSLVLTYRNRRHRSTRFLYGIIIGWALSLISLLLYLGKHNYYFNIITKFFTLDPSFWNALVLMNPDIDWVIRVLNLAVLIFFYSVLGFALSFTHRQTSTPQEIKLYLLLGIIPLLELIFYDPDTYRMITRFFDSPLITATSIDQDSLLEILHIILKTANFIYLAVALFLLFRYYYKYPNIKFLRKYTLFNFLCLLPVVVVHVLTFSWIPRIMIKSTVINGYYNYILPDLEYFIPLMNWLPYIVFLAFTFMVYLIFRYNSIEAYYRHQDVYINRTIDTANLGVRAFTHSMKNHLLAIQSEASFLKDKYQSDQETQKSLDLILSSCLSSFGNIDQAAAKLRNIQLHLKPLKLNIPIDQAVTRFNSLKSTIRIDQDYCEEIPLAYIDEQHLSEALYNIIVNAVEAIGNRENGYIRVSLENQLHWGIISITDNGAGIHTDDLTMIFNPFFSTKSSVANWGIGLTYCHKIVSAHDGKIIIESRPEQGTSFKIMLPLF